MRLVIRSAIVAIALVAAQQAAAVGPWLWTVDGGPGIAGPNGVRYVTRLAGPATKVLAIRDGETLRSVSVPGHWGLQAATLAGGLTGLSGDGRLLVLAPPTRGEPVDVSDVRPRLHARAHAAWNDPAARRLHRRRAQPGREHALSDPAPRPGTTSAATRCAPTTCGPGSCSSRVVADKRQAGWTMHGYPVARAATATEAASTRSTAPSNNYPFIHALDTVGKTAVCVGLPLSWTDQNTLNGARLKLSDDGRRLTVSGPRPRRADHSRHAHLQGHAGRLTTLARGWEGP